MDDFDFDENEEQEDSSEEQKRSAYDRVKDTKDKYDDIKGKVDDAKKYKEQLRNSSQAAKTTGNVANTAGNTAGATTSGAATAGGTAASGAAGSAATAGGTAAASGAAGSAAAAGGTAAASGAATAGAAAGSAAAAGGTAAAAAGAGAATAGIGTVVVLAASALNEMKKKAEKKAAEKGIDIKAQKRKKKIIKWAIILSPIILIFIFIVAGTVWLANEESYTDLFTIIQKREKRYAESGKSTKPLILMSDKEIDEIVKKDYDKNAEPEENRDLCYETYLKEKYNKEYDNYIPTDESSDDNYDVKSEIVKSYLKAERENFNKVVWNVQSLSGDLGAAETKKYKMSSDTSAQEILIMPDVTKYKYSPNADEQQLKDMYVDMLYKHLQMWVIPYSLNIASQDTNFGKDILENMWHPITVTLFQLDRLTKYTTTYYFLKTNVHVDYYKAVRRCSGSGEDRTCWTEYEYTHSDDFESSTASSYTSSNTARYTVTLQKDGLDEYIRAGIKSGPTYDRQRGVYRHIPKATYVEDFYNIIEAKFKIDPISEVKTPVEKKIVLDSSGKEVITEIWDEEIVNDGSSIKDYKVSYYNEKKYETLGRKISRVEWFQDYGSGDEDIFPEKTDDVKTATKLKYFGDPAQKIKPKIQGYSYIDLDFGFQQIDKHFKWIESNGLTGSGNLNSDFVPEGGFLWPVPAILKPGITIDSLISSPFGPRTHPISGKKNTPHTGIDIVRSGIGVQGMYGPDLVASRDGIVTIVGNDPPGYGSFVKIDHGDGYETLYGHMYSISVKKGQDVKQGEKIGVMGTTGNSTGVHLHFEIRKNGECVDPRPYFNDDGSSILSSNQTLSEFGEKTIGAMCAKAIELANTGKVAYCQHKKKAVSTEAELNSAQFFDCSSFVDSLYRTYLGINVGGVCSAQLDKAQRGYTEKGWKGQAIPFDKSKLQPGDILHRVGHVGIYVGDGKYVDVGGGKTGVESCTLNSTCLGSYANHSWRGPKYREVQNNWENILRYTNPDANETVSGDGSAGATGNISLKAGYTVSDLPNSIRPFHTNLMKYSGFIEKYSKQNGIGTLWVMSVIAKESSFRPDAANGSYGTGLMQLEWKGVYDKTYPDRTVLFDPETNIKLGSAHLAGAYKDASNSIYEALGRYRFGAGGWNTLKKKVGITGIVKTIEQANKVCSVSNESSAMQSRQNYYDAFAKYYDIK